jgi:hypothetical protein
MTGHPCPVRSRRSALLHRVPPYLESRHDRCPQDGATPDACPVRLRDGPRLRYEAGVIPACEVIGLRWPEGEERVPG